MLNIKILLFCWKLPSIPSPPPRGWSRDPLWFCCSLWLSWLPMLDVRLSRSPQKRLTFLVSCARTSPGNSLLKHTPRGWPRPTPGSWEQWFNTSTWAQQATVIWTGSCGASHTANSRWVVHKSLHTGPDYPVTRWNQILGIYRHQNHHYFLCRFQILMSKQFK